MPMPMPMPSTRRGPAVGLAAGMLALGCGTPASSSDDGSSTTMADTSGASASTTAGTTTASGTTTAGTSATSSTTTANPTTADTTDATTATGDTSTSDSDPTGGGFDANGCPADAPDSWISCEDFDAIDDAPSQIAEWDAMGDGFGVEADAAGGAGDQALRITLQPGVMFGGWVSLRWGTGPDAPGVDSPGESFDEVWVRYTLRLDDAWPGWPIGDLGEVIAMNGSNWAIAAETAIRGDGNGRLHPLGWTCIFGGALACDGNNDWTGGLQLIWQASGASTIFDAAGAGNTLCVEAHMRLNTPGAADGEAQIWIDGTMETSTTNVDFRGTWDDFGINALRFTNYTSPPVSALDVWVDDVVVATERVGCE
ncbi:MAG: hypothetical protein IPH07_31545 [Deltaproteobacteria bacterium]|nr:hypothetical protein [Deltaproteobacteria bacterium]MBP7287661.1 hypothetical protein [Nannocystaceae bacterium]